jgi:hypothetical protein
MCRQLYCVLKLKMLCTPCTVLGTKRHTQPLHIYLGCSVVAQCLFAPVLPHTGMAV